MYGYHAQCQRAFAELYFHDFTANSESVALLKQANVESAKLADVIGVSDEQLRFVRNLPSEIGVLKCEKI